MGSFSDFAQHMDWAGFVSLLLTVGAVLLCLTVHETCHGLTAYALGDPTAKRQHRLSLNPLRHLDLVGTLMMLVAGFGWARPVPVDMRYFKHPKSGMALTALAGPASNLALAYLALLIRALLLGLYQRSGLPLLLGPVNFCGRSQPWSGDLQPDSLPSSGRLQGAGCFSAGPGLLHPDAL